MDIEFIIPRGRHALGKCQACQANGITTQGPLTAVTITINSVSVPTFYACNDCVALLRDFA